MIHDLHTHYTFLTIDTNTGTTDTMTLLKGVNIQSLLLPTEQMYIQILHRDTRTKMEDEESQRAERAFKTLVNITEKVEI
jgi:hypothetical protein